MSINLPEEFTENMKELLKQDYPLYLDSFNNERVYGLRVNTSKISTEEFERIFPYEIEKIPFISNGYYYHGEDRISLHPYYYAGLFYLQEPSAMLPAEIMPVEENDIILDGCAAPGGKSTQLANKHPALLISNDISTSRCQGLLKNIEMAGITNAYVMSEDLIRLADYYPASFDKILIDAPCSGEGMFRKEPDLIKSWLQRGNQYYSDLQKKIVEAALKMLKQGGIMVYSTCTFSPAEDEDIIEYMKQLDSEVRILDIDKEYEGFSKGIIRNNDADLEKCIRLYPHRIKGEGHFAALVQKGERQEKEIRESVSVNAYSNDSLNEFLKHVNKSITNTVKYGERVYSLPEQNLDSRKLRVLRSGLLLGEIKKDRFEPSTTLALSLKKDEFDNVADLKSDDIRVIKYLKGETVSADVKDGYCLITVDGYSLGFGKANNGVIKNRYEPGWRMR